MQLAHHGHPIYGDAKYGAVHTFGHAIGLHARRLTFLHPVRYEPITLTAEPPRPWRGRFAYLFREGQHERRRKLREIRDLIQVDVNHRGLARDPDANLINACPDDFAAACRSIAETPDAALCVVTGFYIAHADPPAVKPTGRWGRCSWRERSTPLGIRGSALATDSLCRHALQAGVHAAGFDSSSS